MKTTQQFYCAVS